MDVNTYILPQHGGLAKPLIIIQWRQGKAVSVAQKKQCILLTDPVIHIVYFCLIT